MLGSQTRREVMRGRPSGTELSYFNVITPFSPYPLTWSPHMVPLRLPEPSYTQSLRSTVTILCHTLPYPDRHCPHWPLSPDDEAHTFLSCPVFQLQFVKHFTLLDSLLLAHDLQSHTVEFRGCRFQRHDDDWGVCLS